MLLAVAPFPRRDEAMRDIRLKNLREHLGFTQVEVAAKMGIPQASVSRIERQTDLLVSTLTKYLHAMDCDLIVHRHGWEVQVNARTRERSKR